MLDWNDLRYFLAVAREGSTLAGGRALHVSQTTVARRISALEEAVGVRLFGRRQAGYALTPAGEGLLKHALLVEQSALSFEQSAYQLAREIKGIVRITSEEIYTQGLLAPFLRELHDLFPDIVIDIHNSHKLANLGNGAADIALRISSKELQPDLVGRRLCVDHWTLYCSRDYAIRNGSPSSVEDLQSHPIVGGGGDMWPQYRALLVSLGLEKQVAMHHPSSTGLLSAVRSGFGIAVLPCVVADGDPELVRCIAPREGHSRALWLLTHERVRHTPRVRAVVDFLYDRLSKYIRQNEEQRTSI